MYLSMGKLDQLLKLNRCKEQNKEEKQMNEAIEAMIENGDSLEVLSSVNYEWLLELISEGKNTRQR